MMGLALAVIIATLPFKTVDLDEAGVCTSYGVNETSTYYASTVHAQALPYDELQVACAPAVVKSGPVHGCALYQNINGDVFTDIYWLEGSFCAMIHEWCHAANFGGHTTEFITRLRAGDQNPACPRGEVE
jgi:hypothetical protein